MTPPLRWRLGVAGGVALVVLLVDQLTKLAVRAVGDALHVTVIPGVIDFLFVRNIGAAFSMGEGHGVAFALLALAVIVAIAVYLLRAPQLARLEVVGMAMVAGGAIGNAIDRLAFGFVTDFIATTFIDFPVFNVADIGITVGVVLALIGYMFLSPAAREVAFWVQAMQEGDVSPAVLGQSFLFSPDRANNYTDGQAFYTMASYALLGTDVTDGNADAYLPYFAEGGAVQAYKQLFNLTSCVESFSALGVDVGTMDDRIPLDRTVLAQEVEAARATRSTQSTADEADKATYTPGYILRHPVDTVLLFVRSAVENGDHYIRTLVGGSLSYYTVDLAWGWVAVLYLLLAYAALPVQGAVMKPAGKARGWCCAAAALCCLLAVAGCLLWTPTHYDTLYGLQGRYFLPVLPLLLLTCLPRRLAAVPDEDTAQTRLVAALALVQAGMVVNIMLAIIAR